MAKAVGIDLGTTNSVIATVEGRIVVPPSLTERELFEELARTSTFDPRRQQ
jgi:molecular chaperone DnaK (HSP70)